MSIAPPKIPIEDLFADPVMTGATICSDGSRIAYLAPQNGRKQVWIRDVNDDGTITAAAVCVTDVRDRGISRYRWTDDPRWLIYEMDSGGDESWHLFRVDLDNPGATPLDLTPMGPYARVVGFEQPRSLPGKLIVGATWPRLDTIDVHLLDIATGDLSPYVTNPGDVSGWLLTADGGVLAMGDSGEHDYQIGVWDRDSESVRTFATFPGEDYPLGLVPVEATPDGKGLWLGTFGPSDNLRLAYLDIATGEESVVHAEPGRDLDASPMIIEGPSPILRHSGTGALLAARFVGDRPVFKVLDADFEPIFAALDGLHPGVLEGISSDETGSRWVVSFTHDTDPGVTFFYDHGTGRSELLFRPHPRLEPAHLAPMQPVDITARDGLVLPSFLTLPLGVEPVDLPLVLLVHGGPWYRDPWGYDPQVQFFANRGYAVLQVNFRGSLGYGRSHTKAGAREFAGKMHDDLIDAVEWAIERGYADRSRVGIFGTSYGGYAALVGATFTPDVFACAIDCCGISDLTSFQRTLPPFVRDLLHNNWGRYVGDPDIPADEADMLARSPISRIDRVSSPLMVIQGANDARVVKAESDNIVEGLRARGVEVEYLVKDDEGHGFQNPENVIDMFNAIERFAAAHLG